MPTQQQQPLKLSELIGQTILINSYKEIQGKYGTQYLCKTDDGQSLFSNKQIHEFIVNREQQRDMKGPFTISPVENQSFENSSGNTITYTTLKCSDMI